MKKRKVEVTKTTQIAEVLRINPNVKDVLLGFGLHCLGCPMSQMESLEDACAVHGIDIELLLEKVNEFLNQEVQFINKKIKNNDYLDKNLYSRCFLLHNIKFI